MEETTGGNSHESELSGLPAVDREFPNEHRRQCRGVSGMQ
jgi:hypothetical protein